MRRRWTTWGFVLLLTLNVSALGTLVYHRWTGAQPRGCRTRHRLGRDRFFRDELRLSDEQWRRVEQLRRSFETDIEPLRRKLREKNSEMVRLLRKGDPDRGRLQAVLNEIADVQKQVQARIAEHLLKEGRVLTPEQRDKLFDLIQQGVCSGEDHHGLGGELGLLGRGCRDDDLAETEGGKDHVLSPSTRQGP